MSASDVPRIEQHPSFWGAMIPLEGSALPLSTGPIARIDFAAQRSTKFVPFVPQSTVPVHISSFEGCTISACGTVAAGAMLAALIHVGDFFSLPLAFPSAIGGVALHVLPPLAALISSAMLSVFSQKRSGKNASPSTLQVKQGLLLMAAFSAVWTAFDWTMHRHSGTSMRHDALPVELFLTLVTFLFCNLSTSVGGRGAWTAHHHVLVCGMGSVATGVKDYFESRPELGYRVRGVLHLHRARGAAVYAEHLVRQARHKFADEILLTAHPGLEYLEHIFEHARAHKIGVRLIPDISEVLLNTNAIDHIGTLPVISLYSVPQRSISLVCKRALDITLSAALLAVLSPIFFLLAILIRLESAGPSFYASERIGRRGQTFTCYKFRTMVRDAEALRQSLAHLNEREGVLFKISSDPRITRLGAWLRKYSLDELPQLWNVFRGDMSLVGPRPSLPSEVQQYETHHLRRLDVIPGMTGLWQVEARNDPSFESYIALDSKYADNWSLSMDLMILARTFRVVFLGTGV
jgi:exopolysaccharide biosynthesis polyprenyl glycosylphosphotransferase